VAREEPRTDPRRGSPADHDYLAREGRVAVAERMGTELAEVLRAALTDPLLALTDAQRAAIPGVLRRILGLSLPVPVPVPVPVDRPVIES
jgi:hypothetical protein